MRPCSVEGCDKLHYGKGLCDMHYRRMRATGDPLVVHKMRGTVEERLNRRTVKDAATGCWLWMGATTDKGYGAIQGGGRGSKMLLAHRVSYEIHKGPIPSGMLVLHSCDNPQCINPEHLRLGTQSENILEAFAKGRKYAPIYKGEANPRSKITAEQARFIKAHPELPHTELARLFGVSPNCIRGVRIGRTWK